MKETMSENVSPSNKKRKITAKQVAAIIAIVLLVLLYLVTLVSAIVDRENSGRWFRMSLVATLVLPILIWIYTWIYSKFQTRHDETEVLSQNEEEN